MTRLWSMPPHPVDYGQCHVEHLADNSVILSYARPMALLRSTLAVVDGGDLGIESGAGPGSAEEAAAPLFKMVLEAHNQALSTGRKLGSAEVKIAVRRAIEGE